MIKKTAAGTLALSLFLFPAFSSTLAEESETVRPEGIAGQIQLDLKVVMDFMETATDSGDGEEKKLLVYRSAAARAASMLRKLEEPESGDDLPAWGLDEAATYANVEQQIRAAINLPQKKWTGILKGQKLSTYDGLARAQEAFSALEQLLMNTVADALEEQREALLDEIPGALPGAVEIRLPQRVFCWKEMAGLYRSFGKELFQILSESAMIRLSWKEDCCLLSLEFPLFDEVAAQGTREQAMNCRFALVYLNTVYDDAGVFKEYEPYVFQKAYLDQMIHPLQGDYLIKDGWYDSRSRGTRMHTGTDIKAPARTPIHSITDGVVTDIGYMDIPGNFVVVRDRYGFDYHYYHMVEESKEVVEGQIVKQGDVIGLVGNTGNSASDHLHLAVISPEDTYINPYDMFLEAGIGPIKPRMETE